MIPRRHFLKGAAGQLCLLDTATQGKGLRLHEAGMIKSSPQKILQGTDWRFFNELKKELKT